MNKKIMGRSIDRTEQLNKKIMPKNSGFDEDQRTWLAKLMPMLAQART